MKGTPPQRGLTPIPGLNTTPTQTPVSPRDPLLRGQEMVKWPPSDSDRKTAANDPVGAILKRIRGCLLEWARRLW